MKITNLLILLSIGFVQAQYTAIPDSNFEQTLINQGIDSDGIINGQVLNVDIANITELNLQSQNINDLTGIEGFSLLENLNCNSNSFTTLDLSNNINLKILEASVLNITTLDLSNNISLIELSCRVNHILQNVNLSNLSNLKVLDFADNWALSSVDFSDCVNLEELYYENIFSSNTVLNLNQNINLKTLYFSGFPFTSINLNNNILLENLICPNNNLTSLDLSNNTALKLLDCGDRNCDFGFFNAIQNLDLTNNINLEVIDCHSVGLENINLSNCILLGELNLGLNPLTGLDLSSNINLKKLECINSNLSIIDLTNNINLENLDLHNGYSCDGSFLLNWNKNNFTQLNLNNNTNIKYLNLWNNEGIEKLYFQNQNNPNIIGFNTMLTPSLTCIFVDNKDYSILNWTNVDDATNHFVETENECQTLSLNQFNNIEKFNIFPNPTNNNLTIKINDITSDIIIVINDISGRKVFSKSLHFTDNVTSIDVSNLEANLYFVSLITNKGISTQKFVKN